MRAMRIGALSVFLLAGCSAQITAVVNAASGLPFVGPGMLISIYGIGMTPDGCTASAPSVPWPISLCGVLVGFNLDTRYPSDLLPIYVSPTQINAFYPVFVP